MNDEAWKYGHLASLLTEYDVLPRLHRTDMTNRTIDEMNYRLNDQTEKCDGKKIASRIDGFTV